MERNNYCYYKSALNLFLPVKVIEEIDGFDIQLGNHHYYFRSGAAPVNNFVSSTIAGNKFCTNKVLEAASVPVPKSVGLSCDDFNEGLLETIIAPLTFPLVIKPTYLTSYGTDVICNIKDIESLNENLSKLFETYEHISIEEFHGNMKSYRVLVFNNKIIAVSRRYPASVVGDGKHNIEQLIDLTNIERHKLRETLGKIVIDVEMHIKLKEMGLKLNDIPPKGKRITLCYTCNASRGGSMKELSKKMCRKNKKLMIKIANELNLSLTGIDIECQGLDVPIEETGGVIIEANYNPSIFIHEEPMMGPANNVSKHIVKSLIFKHPFAYLHNLYTNKRTQVYCRIVLVLVLLSIGSGLFNYFAHIYLGKG